MENVDYVRVRSTDPLARIRAERVERYEKLNIIKLQNLSFEQYGNKGSEVNVSGRLGYALVEIDSGDIYMENGVKLEVQTEDVILETDQLEWKDEPRTISTGENQEVYIYRDNGTSFTGIGLQADSRLRTWEFLGIVRGTYIHDDTEE
jgi:LPS export ABC transporter protein LptC